MLNRELEYNNEQKGKEGIKEEFLIHLRKSRLRR
jgi:hypothetical protein